MQAEPTLCMRRLISRGTSLPCVPRVIHKMRRVLRTLPNWSRLPPSLSVTFPMRHSMISSNECHWLLIRTGSPMPLVVLSR